MLNITVTPRELPAPPRRDVQVPAGNRSCTAADNELERLPTLTLAAKVRVAITCLLFLSSACCNGAVLWAVAKQRQRWWQRRHRRRLPRVGVLMANLAAADLLVTLVVMPLDAVWNATVQWHGGDAACRALMFLKLAAMYASAFVTVVIAVDRHAAIVTPLARGSAEKRVRAMLGAAWALSALLALPQAFVFHTVRRSRPRRFVQCATLGSFGARWKETLYNLFTFGLLFLLPLLVMVLCYGRILATISGGMKAAHASSREIQLRRSSDNIPRARMRTLRMSIVIVLTFIVCWTPYYLLGLWYWFSPEMLTREKVPPSLSHILFLFGLFNTCLDPLIYGFFTARSGRRRQRQEGADAFTGSFRGSFRVSALARRAGNSPLGSGEPELVPDPEDPEDAGGTKSHQMPPGSCSAINPDGFPSGNPDVDQGMVEMEPVSAPGRT